MTHPPQHDVPSPQHLRWALGIHAAVYVCVNVLLAIIDLNAGGSTWFYWPMVGWGIGLAFHAWLVGSRLGWWMQSRD